MNDIVDRLWIGTEQMGLLMLPLAGAALILVTGYFLARQIGIWVEQVLRRLNFNRVADAGGLAEAMGRAGSHLDPANAIGRLMFWLVMLVVILLTSTALGLESINEMFGLMLSYIPTVIAAVVIIILGMIVGEFVRGLILASAGTVAGVLTVAKVAKASVVIIAIFMALQQVGVAEEIVTATFTLILGAIALAVGLAFGLGNRDLAGEITRRWYEEGRQRREAVAAALRQAEIEARGDDGGGDASP